MFYYKKKGQYLEQKSRREHSEKFIQDHLYGHTNYVTDNTD